MLGKNQQGFTLVEFIWLTGVIICIVSWSANIVKLVGMNPDPVTIELLMRVAGVVLPPLGVVMGFI